MGKEKEDQLEKKKEIKYHRRLNDMANAHLVMLLLPSLAYLVMALSLLSCQEMASASR